MLALNIWQALTKRPLWSSTCSRISLAVISWHSSHSFFASGPGSMAFVASTVASMRRWVFIMRLRLLQRRFWKSHHQRFAVCHTFFSGSEATFVVGRQTQQNADCRAAGLV